MGHSSMSFEMACRILGAADDGWSARLSRLLGVAALASGGVGAAAPAAAVGAAWGWIDQKNELVGHIDAAVRKVRDRGIGRTGRERHELIAAAHTALVTGSFFTALSEQIGSGYQRLHFSEAEKRAMVTPEAAGRHSTVVAQLLDVPVPVPWVGRGFEANLHAAIMPFFESLAGRCLAFFQGLAAWERLRYELGAVFGDQDLRRRIVESALRTYRSGYRHLAASMPEFGMWALLDEFEVASAARQRSLALLETLLAATFERGQPPPARDRQIMAQRNRRLLTEPLAQVTEFDRLSGVRIPDVETGYVNPRFRWAVTDRDARTWDEEWWDQQSSGHQLDRFLAAYFTSARAAEQPLVILGHPGAGKSLLTKITAARLPAELYATVRVPLRRVKNPAAPIYQQIQDFLDDDTHFGVRWRELSDASRDLTRVVLLDGLDELMQATGTTESGFLHEVQRFQEKEAGLGSPVAVVVTSRTVVANIANIPAGSLVIKLEDFDKAQVDEWVEMWNQVNHEPIAGGSVKPLAAEAVWAMGDLARQPLLLLMLATFGATEDPPSGATGGVTQGQLYQWLLNGYVTREVAKSLHGTGPAPESDGEVSERAERELWQLGIAAFAMFNRGQQSVSGEDLNRDLEPMLPPQVTYSGHRKHLARPLDAAMRTIARFFFIHTADVDSDHVTGSSYEFLHATFGEYLIAYHTLNQLGGLADARRHVPLGQEWTDDQLFALLSHQQLAVGGAILPFVRELFGALPQERRGTVVTQLKALVQASQERAGVGRLPGYNPSGRSLLSRVASYTGNLLLLLVELSDWPVALADLAPAGADHLTWWRSTVRLLRSGLDDTGWAMLLSTLDISTAPEPVVYRRRTPIEAVLLQAYEARLACQPEHELQALLGITALHGRRVPYWDEPIGDAAMRVVSSLVHRDERPDDEHLLLTVADRSPELDALLAEYLVRHGARLPYPSVRTVLSAPLSSGSVDVAVRIAPVAAQHPELLREFQQLINLYSRGLPDARAFAEVFAAMRVGLTVWPGATGDIFKDALRHMVRQARDLGEASFDAVREMVALPEEVLRPAIPPVVAILADEYAPRGPVSRQDAPAASGRHRPDPATSPGE
ncbi:NACHT domain-containing protein [Phytohabitans houttuyneae]|uniref:NACHT N-terminal Helical domain-containing protein n=1 Tax=Phytohabitans houttuyneae TaxID=1076126 RepID=A0A6V8KEI0_9ACTN|nr:hypothetical protein [Phytohabitans houttuyneae]GFJ81830.1 hypothetical protein Phou_060100 [Phytohabitans houttuyneae]